MAILLKQSTAVTVKMGPFVDSGDLVTPEISLTIQKADVRLSKNGGNMAAANANQGPADAGAPHDEIGVYDIDLDTTDTDTVGVLRADIQESGAAPVFAEFMVLPANVYDSLMGTDLLQIDVEQVDGSATAAANLSLSTQMIVPGTVDDSAFTPTTTEFEAVDITEATTDHFNGRYVIFTSGALAYEARQITGYSLSGSNGHFTVEVMTEAPADGDTFIIV